MKSIMVKDYNSLFNDFLKFVGTLQNKKRVIIKIHDGVFHSDDATIVALIYLIIEYFNIHSTVKIIRSRKNIQCDFQFDVGGCYSPEKGIFDHHGTDAPCRIDGQKLCSATQLWYGVGYQLIHMIADDLIDEPYDLSIISRVWKKLDKNFFMPLDRKDNGNKSYIFGEMMDFTAIISSFNDFEDPYDSSINDEQFFKAVKIAKEIIYTMIKNAILTEIGKQKLEEILSTAAKEGKVFAFVPKGLGNWKTILNSDNWESFHNMRGILSEAEPGIYGITMWPDTYEPTFGLKCKLKPEMVQTHGMKFVHFSGFYGTFEAKNLKEAAEKAAKIFADVEMVEP